MSKLSEGRTAPLVHFDAASGGRLTFDALFAEALEEIQRRAGKTWTDHNVHDPGITLLDAGLWGVADLLFRVDATDDVAPVDLDEPDVRPPEMKKRSRAVLEHAFLERFDDLIGAVQPELSSGGDRAADLVASLDERDDPESRQARRLRLRARRRLLELFTSIALRGFASEALDLRRIVRLTESRARRWLLHTDWDQLREPLGTAFAEASSDEVHAKVHERCSAALRDQTVTRDLPRDWDAAERRWGPSDSRLLERLEPAQGDLLTLLARLERRLEPELFEDKGGQTRVWPPHPSQVTDVDPTSPSDILLAAHRHLHGRAASGDPLYGSRTNDAPRPRLWLVAGAVEGLRCDGRTSPADSPRLPGAQSLLVERGGEWEGREAELLRCCCDAFEVEASRRYWSDLSKPERSTRPLGLELYFGFVRPVKVHVAATLHARPGSVEHEIAESARNTLRRFLVTGAPGPATDYPYATGWPPGGEVQEERVRALLLSLNCVEDVSSLRIRIERRGSPVPGGRLEPFEVPDREPEFAGLAVLGSGVEDFNG